MQLGLCGTKVTCLGTDSVGKMSIGAYFGIAAVVAVFYFSFSIHISSTWTACFFTIHGGDTAAVHYFEMFDVCFQTSEEW